MSWDDGRNFYSLQTELVNWPATQPGEHSVCVGVEPCAVDSACFRWGVTLVSATLFFTQVVGFWEAGVGCLVCAFPFPLAFPFFPDPLLPFPTVVKKCWGMAIVCSSILAALCRVLGVDVAVLLAGVTCGGT